MKNLIKIIMVYILAFSLVGCNYKSYQEVTNTTKTINSCIGNGYFTELIQWEDSHHWYYIVYANDTKVKYFICKGRYRFGITPLYNTDGSLQVYEGE